jgi:hypothetical protein
MTTTQNDTAPRTTVDEVGLALLKPGEQGQSVTVEYNGGQTMTYVGPPAYIVGVVNGALAAPNARILYMATYWN